MALLAVLLTAKLAGAAAITNNWLSSTGDSYTNKTSWDAGVLPTVLDTATVGNVFQLNGVVLYTNALGDPAGSNALNALFLGNVVTSSGTVTQSDGCLSITNAGANAFLLGFGNGGSSGTYVMNGGVLNLVRNASTFFQDYFQPGFSPASQGTFILNGGQVNCIAGIEIGLAGTGVITVNGGTLVDNGWFGIGRGNSATSLGDGTFNLNGGTVYQLRNPGTDGGAHGLAFCQNGVNAAVNITGGTLFCNCIRFAVGPGAGRSDNELFTMSGGNVYLGANGVINGGGGGTHTISILLSGGTFHGVNLGPNTGGTQLTNSVGSGGTNWTWVTNFPATLNTSPGPGTVNFQADAGKTITLNAPFSGAGALAFTGPGAIVLGATEAYTGGTTLSGGSLIIAAAQTNSLGLSMSSGTTLIITNNGSLVESPLSIPSGVTLNFSASANHLFTNDLTGSGKVAVTVGSTILETATGNLGHSGATLISNGTFIVNGTLNSSSGVAVTNTGTLAGSGTISSPITVASPTVASAHLRTGSSPLNVPGTLTVGNLTLGAGSELDIKLGTATTTGSGVNDLLVINGNLTIDPTSVLNILPLQPLSVGTYVIATYTGALTGNFNPTVGSLSRYGMTIDYSTTNQIKLNVTGNNASLTWAGFTNTGPAATNWDVLTTSNWWNGAVGGTKDFFREGDAVAFDDTATNFNVVLTTTLYPASISFNNNSNYSVTGTGTARISGSTGITKSGNGTLLMASGLGFGNDFTGPIQVNGGIFKMNGTLSLGATNGGTTVASGATLDINGNTPNAEPMIVQGAGFGGTNGAINNSSGTAPNQAGGPRAVTLAGDTTLNAQGARWDMGLNTLGAGGGYFLGNGYNLTKIGANDIWLHELGDIGVGDIIVTQGLLGFQYTIGMGNPSKTITLNPGTSLGIFQVPAVLNKNASLTSATINSSGGAGTSNALNGTITLAGTNTFTDNGQKLTLSGLLTGTGGFQKSGAGTLYLNSVDNYSGVTVINAGSIVLGAASAITNSPLIFMGSGTMLDSTLAGGLNLHSGETLSGFGTNNGSVTAASGSSLSPGNATTAGTLTFNNNLSLSSVTCNIKLSSDPSSIGNGVNDLLAVSGNLTLNGTTAIQITPLGPLSGGSPYTIMQYGPGLTGGAANLTVSSGNPRYNFTVVDPTTTAPYIQISVGGNAGTLIWKGGHAPNPNAWDHGTPNWLNTSTLAADTIFSGDIAVFDDTASTNIVNIVGTNNPSTIVTSNNAAAFTFVGGGLLIGSVDMEGTGSLTLAMSNAPIFTGITNNAGTLVFQLTGTSNRLTAPMLDNGGGQGKVIQGGTNTFVLTADNSLYTGAILVTNGVLEYTNAIGLGAAAAALYVTNNGMLDLNGLAPGLKNINIAGNGFNGRGALVNYSANGLVNAGTANLTLTGDASIAGSNRWDIVGNSFNANGHSLTELGPNSTLIEVPGDGTLADIHIVAGRLGFQGAGVTMGDPTKTCTIESNATLTFFNANTTNGETKTLVMKGGAVFDSGGGNNIFNGPVFLTGTNLIGTRTTLTITNSISDTNGPGGFILGADAVGASAGDLYLSGVNTYSGPTIITNQTLYVGAGSSLGNSSLILVAIPGTLNVSSQSTFSVGAGQTVAGNGNVIGNTVAFGNNATLAPGLGGADTSPLALNGAITLSAGSTNKVVVNKTIGIANSEVTGLTSVAMAGTLVVNNVGGGLAANDAIPLFSAGSYSGGFTTIIPATPGAGLAWNTSTLATDGTLRVAIGVNPNPTNLVVSVSGNQLTFSWPGDHTGWTLQSQTNSVLGAWFDVPGSSSVSQITITVDPANKDVFYRLVLHQ